jgi:hypothetical protein
MSETIQAQVLAQTKLKPKPGETAHEFTMRAAKKLHGLSDEAWEEVSDPVQVWTNDNILADEKGSPLFDMLEVPEVEAEVQAAEPEGEASEPEGEEVAEEAPVEGVEVETEAEKEPVVATKSVKKSNGKKAPAAKPKAAAKPAKAAKAKPANGETRGRKPNLDPDQKIKLLVDENPHRAGSGRHKRWPKYKDGMTVAQAIAAGLNYANIHYSVKDGHIKIV